MKCARPTRVWGRRPKIGDRVQILVDEEPFKRGDRGIVESVGTLAVTIRLERDPTRRGTLIGANLSGRLLIIDPREGT